MKFILTSLLLIALAVSCKNISEETKNASNQNDIDNSKLAISRFGEALFDISVPENKFIFQTNQSQILVTDKMSRIYIPKNTFVDKNGGLISGKVELVFKEYQSIGEIIASEIPMIWKDPKTGVEYDFESDGMFEIQAYQNDQELFVKKGKEIQVDLVANSRKDFNFYSIESRNSDWQLIETNCKALPNAIKNDLNDQLIESKSVVLEKPRKPVEYKKGDQLFDVNMSGTNREHDFKLDEFNGVMWKLTETNDSILEAFNAFRKQKSFKQVRFEPIETEFLEYRLYFLSEGNKEISFDGAPVFQGKLLSNQKEKYKEMIAKMAQKARKDKELKEQINRESDLLRRFNLDKMGIFNYDIQFKDDNNTRLLASFSFDGLIDTTEIKHMNVYLVPEDVNVVVRYEKNTFQNFAINLRRRNTLLAIASNNQIYYLSDGDIKRLNLAQFKNKDVEINLKKYKIVKDAKEIDDLISKL